MTSVCLSKQEHSTVDECLSMWISNLTLTNDDKRRLFTGEWLTANHISAAQLLLKHSFPQQNGLCDTSYLVEKFSWSSSPHEFVQIIHVGGSHWACLSNVFCSREHDVVELFDSMPPDDLDNTIKEQAATIMHCESERFTICVVNVQWQEKGDTCGMFAVAMAYDLCNRKDPFLSSYNETRMRTHLRRCFEQETITRFPGSDLSRRNRRKRIINEVSIDVLCLSISRHHHNHPLWRHGLLFAL